MNGKLLDKGLKKAVKEQQTFKLPSNFAYQTIQRIEEAIRLREKKTERRTLFAMIVAAITLVGGSIAGLIVYFGDSIREAFTLNTAMVIKEIQIPPLYILMILAVPLFFAFDRWMRKQYFKHHS